MARLLLLLLPLLLGAACNQRTAPPPPPPPEVQNPRPQGPFDFEQDGFILVVRHVNAGIAAQIYAGPEDGSWRDVFAIIQPVGPNQPRYFSMDQLRLRQGRLEIWAQDLSWNRAYGGRRFRWVYHYRVDDTVFPPRLVLPDGPVAYEVLPSFPWGEQNVNDGSVTDYLRDVSVGGAFQICIRQDWSPREFNLRKGMFSNFWMRAGNPASTTNYNFLVTYTWFDGEFTGRPGIQGSGGPALGTVRPGMDFSNPTIFDSSPQTHSAVLISKSLGTGSPRQAWEGRWFRAYNKGFGAWPDPSQTGGVRCEYGEGWRVEEVTDPAEVALLEQYQVNIDLPNYYSRPPYPLFTALNPRLCPTPWRRGDGTCDMQ